MPAWLIKLLWQVAPYIVAAAGAGFGYLMLEKARREVDRADRYKQVSEAHKAAAEATAKTEAEKTRIRQEFDEKEREILTGGHSVTGGMSVRSRGKHNHSFYKPCGPGCPLYRGGRGVS